MAVIQFAPKVDTRHPQSACLSCQKLTRSELKVCAACYRAQWARQRAEGAEVTGLIGSSKRSA